MLAKLSEGKSFSHTLSIGISCSGVVKRPRRTVCLGIGKAKARSGNSFALETKNAPRLECCVLAIISAEKSPSVPSVSVDFAARVIS